MTISISFSSSSTTSIVMTISHTIVIKTSSISIIMTINTSHANTTGGITNDILNILDITDSLYTNDILDTIDIYYTRGKLIPIAITILVILI